jgi:ligand-binding sensor protein
MAAGAVTADKLDSTIGVWTRAGDDVFRSVGKVGIGTNTPQTALHVVGDVTAQAFGGNWHLVSNDAAALPNRAYLVQGTNQVALTLPASPALGDTMRVCGAGTGGWKLSQNDGQRIETGNLGLNCIGAIWTLRTGSLLWLSVASSADGTKLVGVVNGGQIYTSADSGVTWIARASSQNWEAVASSADGVNLVATVQGGKIYTSKDSGETWTAHDSDRNWFAVASSADGIRLLAAVSNGQLYVSGDGGGNLVSDGKQPTLASRRLVSRWGQADGRTGWRGLHFV